MRPHAAVTGKVPTMSKAVQQGEAAAGKAGLLARLRHGIAALLGGGEGSDLQVDPDLAEAARRRLREGGSNRAEEVHLVEGIRRLLGSNAAPLVGRLNLIGLARIRTRFGSEWPRIAQRADRIARNVIERHIAPGDVYASWGEDAYIMVFARLGEAEARIKCVLIAREIAKMLLGEDSHEELETRTAVSRLDGALDFAALNSLDDLLDTARPVDSSTPDKVELALREMEAKPEPEPHAGHAPDSSAPPFAEPAFASVPAEPAVTYVPIEHRHRSKVTFQPGLHANVLAGIDFVFRPIWDPRLSVIATYYCAPRVQLSDCGSAGDAELAVAGDPEAIARLDAATVERVKQEFAAMAAAGRRLVIAAPLHFETLSSLAQRRRVAATIGQIAEGMKSRLMIEIVGVPIGIQHSRIIDIVSPLRPHCRGVALQMPMEAIDFSQLAGTGIAAVGADLSNTAKAEFIQMQQLSRFQRAAEKVRVATFVHGVHTVSMVAAALGAGFHFIDGDAVAPSVSHAGRALEFRLADLYHVR